MKGLGKNINVDFTEQALQKTRERELELNSKLIAERDKNHWHLNALKTALDQLKTGVDRNVVIRDIEQYLIDLGMEC